VRSALNLLELEVERRARVKRWQSAVKVVGDSGLDIQREFRRPARFKKLP
jgi:hypothetical protein